MSCSCNELSFCERNPVTCGIGVVVGICVLARLLSGAGVAVLTPAAPLVGGVMLGTLVAYEIWEFSEVTCKLQQDMKRYRYQYNYKLCKAGIPPGK